MLSTFEIIILIIAVVAAVRLSQSGGTWWWAVVTILFGLALLLIAGFLLVPVLSIWWGPTRISMNPQMVMASAAKLALAIEFTAAVVLGQMAFVPKLFTERPTYYIWRAIGLGLVVWIVIGLIF